MIEILIIVCILETLLVLGCIVGLATEKDKRDRLEQAWRHTLLL